MRPEDRLGEAAKQVRIARENIENPGEMQALLRIETDIRGAQSMLEQWREEVDGQGGGE